MKNKEGPPPLAKSKPRILDRVVDFNSRSVTITEGAWQHVLRHHPDMALEWERVRQTLRDPDLVVEQVHGTVREWVYHKGYDVFAPSTPYLRAVVRWLTRLRGGIAHGGDGFLTSSYRSRIPAIGAIVWQKT